MSNVADIVRRARSSPDHTGQQQGQRDPTACAAHGCPCRASVDLASTGRASCSWHAWADPDRWPTITERLCEHQWLIDHIDDLYRAFNRGKSGEWLVVADSFWRTQPAFKPQAVERDSFNRYVWRLREYLGHLVGVRKDVPQPRPPLAAQLPPIRKPVADVEEVL